MRLVAESALYLALNFTDGVLDLGHLTSALLSTCNELEKVREASYGCLLFRTIILAPFDSG